MPMPMPVLPAVPSTIAPPGLRAPLATASWMIASAARSLTDPPGFMNSALPRIVHPVSSEAALSWISGVRPIASTTEGLNFMAASRSPGSGLTKTNVLRNHQARAHHEEHDRQDRPQPMIGKPRREETADDDAGNGADQQ